MARAGAPRVRVWCLCVDSLAGRGGSAHANRPRSVEFGHSVNAETSVMGVWTVRACERRTEVSVTGYLRCMLIVRSRMHSKQIARSATLGSCDREACDREAMQGAEMSKRSRLPRPG